MLCLVNEPRMGIRVQVRHCGVGFNFLSPQSIKRPWSSDSFFNRGEYLDQNINNRRPKIIQCSRFSVPSHLQASMREEVGPQDRMASFDQEPYCIRHASKKEIMIRISLLFVFIQLPSPIQRRGRQCFEVLWEIKKAAHPCVPAASHPSSH